MTNLNVYNYLNLSGYIVNAFFTFFGASILPLTDIAEISRKYQAIVTPDGLTFAIWGIIFLSQGIFAVVQMLAAYRSLDIVQKTVKYWYFITCIAQAAWVIAFGFELFILSFIFMTLILVSLCFIVILQSGTAVDSPKEFWLFRFPFEIHCGWICAAFTLNLNLIVITSGGNAVVQIVFGSLTYAFLLGIALYVIFGFKNGPNYTIPLVFSWATFGIVRSLRDPEQIIIDTFSNGAISGFAITAGVLSLALLIVTFIALYQEYPDEIKKIIEKIMEKLKSGASTSDPSETTPLTSVSV